MNITEDLKRKVWERGLEVDGYPPTQVRKDACGAWILFNMYGTNSPYSWQIDHIVPISLLEAMGIREELRDNIINLRPLNTANNISKSDNYPSYSTAVIASGNENIERVENKIVNKEVQDNLKNFYGL